MCAYDVVLSSTKEPILHRDACGTHDPFTANLSAIILRMDTAIALKAHSVVDASYEHVEVIVAIVYHGAAASGCAHGPVVEHFYHAPCTAEHVLCRNRSSV